MIRLNTFLSKGWTMRLITPFYPVDKLRGWLLFSDLMVKFQGWLIFLISWMINFLISIVKFLECLTFFYPMVKFLRLITLFLNLMVKSQGWPLLSIPWPINFSTSNVKFLDWFTFPSHSMVKFRGWLPFFLSHGQISRLITVFLSQADHYFISHDWLIS